MAQKLFVPLHPQNRKNNILESSNRGVAQLVAFLVWDQAVAGSSPVTPTKVIKKKFLVTFFIPISRQSFFAKIVRFFCNDKAMKMWLCNVLIDNALQKHSF